MGAEQPSTPRRNIAVLAAALPPLCVSFQLFWVLHAPLAGTNRQWALDAWLLMATEFFLVHAGALSAAFAVALGPSRRAAFMAILAGFYGFFMYKFWTMSGESWIVASAGLLLAGRLISAAIGGEQGYGERVRTSLFCAVLYLILVGVTSEPRTFPSFGFTPEVLEQLRSVSGGGQGLWIREPHRVVWFGAVYFLVLGLFELWRLVRRWLVP